MPGSGGPAAAERDRSPERRAAGRRHGGGPRPRHRPARPAHLARPAPPRWAQDTGLKAGSPGPRTRTRRGAGTGNRVPPPGTHRPDRCRRPRPVRAARSRRVCAARPRHVRVAHLDGREESHGVECGVPDGAGSAAGARSHAGVVEGDDIAPCRQRVHQRRVPAVERAAEVPEEEQRRPGAPGAAPAAGAGDAIGRPDRAVRRFNAHVGSCAGRSAHRSATSTGTVLSLAPPPVSAISHLTDAVLPPDEGSRPVTAARRRARRPSAAVPRRDRYEAGATASRRVPRAPAAPPSRPARHRPERHPRVGTISGCQDDRRGGATCRGYVSERPA